MARGCRVDHDGEMEEMGERFKRRHIPTSKIMWTLHWRSMVARWSNYVDWPACEIEVQDHPMSGFSTTVNFSNLCKSQWEISFECTFRGGPQTRPNLIHDEMVKVPISSSCQISNQIIIQHENINYWPQIVTTKLIITLWWARWEIWWREEKLLQHIPLHFLLLTLSTLLHNLPLFSRQSIHGSFFPLHY